MKIRKEFKVESAHIVRNCTSHRCSHSIHGHSAVIEVFLEGNKLDNAGMLYDFGLMKTTIKEYIDSMDHCYLLWDKDAPGFKNFIMDNCDRFIILPFNPSAENLAMYIQAFVNKILINTITNNGEGEIKCTGVRYHETTTGWAESSEDDLKYLWDPYNEGKIYYSQGVRDAWSDDLYDIIMRGVTVVNPIIEQQVK
jgi:6-pyruvoyltetrahydropterin/6-carboxytetrahydropterin synthase